MDYGRVGENRETKERLMQSPMQKRQPGHRIVVTKEMNRGWSKEVVQIKPWLI